MQGRDDSRTTRDEDAAVEAALLMQVLELHPAQATVGELVRELAGEEAGRARGRFEADLSPHGAGLYGLTS